jgi:hypothetical protein
MTSFMYGERRTTRLTVAMDVEEGEEVARMRSQALNSDKTQEAVYPRELILHLTAEI